MSDEQWKDVEGWPGYRISNKGRVFSKFKNDVMTSIPLNGYMNITFRQGDGHGNETRKTTRIHRVVAQHFVHNPDPMTKKVVNHKDGNKANNIAENLEWCTSGENNQHAFDTGLKSRFHKTYNDRPVCAIDPKSYVVTKTYTSIGRAAEAVGCSHGMIRGACERRPGDREVGGSLWCFEEVFHDDEE